MEDKYSVLMSVYCKEKPEYLRQSMESIFKQTVPTDDFVLVCDGPLTKELNAVIKFMQRKSLHVIRLEKNVGLGNALNEGMKHCQHDLVLRMDSDDISLLDRCERELKVFAGNSDVSIVSGTVVEFRNDVKNVIGKRTVPETDAEIRLFAGKRNPFNHPAVMLRKSAVISAGGYQETYPLFEDYYLWVRMLMKGSKGFNIKEPVLYMRISKEFYMRRGGIKYAKNLLRFHRWLYSIHWSSWTDYILSTVLHTLVCVLPNSVRANIYKKLHD